MNAPATLAQDEAFARIRLLRSPNIGPVSYAQLLDTFWKNVDPFDAAGQFCDKGESYLSAIFVAGAAVQWLRDGLQLIQSSAEVERLAATVPDSGGVYVVPAFVVAG